MSGLGVPAASLEAALDFAARQIAVLPLHYPVVGNGPARCSCGNPKCDSNAAKHPFARLAPKGSHSASKDPTAIRRWFAGGPYNLGVRTGRESGIVVIDVDPRHGGDRTLSEHERRFGPLPPTWRFLTGGGGEHILFKHPGWPISNDAGTKLGPGIDARGEGGYIVAPPSRHICGRTYQISVDHHPDDVPLADLPDWLAGMLRSPAKSDKGCTTMPENWRKLIAEGVSEGRRNHAIARLAGLLLRRYVDPLVVLDLCRTWNTGRCRPPLDDDELEKTVDSICAREMRRRGLANG
jgi:putative DNA primase/helicase